MEFFSVANETFVDTGRIHQLSRASTWTGGGIRIRLDEVAFRCRRRTR